MKTLQIDSFETLSSDELISVQGGAGASSLNPLISGLLSDLTLTLAALLATTSKTVTDASTNADAALGGLGLGNLAGGGLLGGSGNGLLGGGINL